MGRSTTAKLLLLDGKGKARNRGAVEREIRESQGHEIKREDGLRFVLLIERGTRMKVWVTYGLDKKSSMNQLNLSKGSLLEMPKKYMVGGKLFSQSWGKNDPQTNDREKSRKKEAKERSIR